MMSKISAVMMLAVHLRGAELAAIGPYESRGKGKGRRQASTNTAAQVKRASVKAANRARHKRHAA
jgi:hypothetical protein